VKHLHKFKVVKGKNLTKVEVASWSSEKMISFLNFCSFFMKTKEGKEVWDINFVRVKAKEETADGDEVEYMARIDCPTWNPKFSPGRFMFKINSSLRVLLGWLKNNPQFITKELEERLKMNSRFAWALQPFNVKESLMGIETVEPNDRSVALDTPELQFNVGLLKLASIFQHLTKDIKATDLKNLRVETKLKYAMAIAPILARSLSVYKPNKMVFTQINVNSSKREDLEKAMMEYHDQSKK
jgi:hypothetical protein